MNLVECDPHTQRLIVAQMMGVGLGGGGTGVCKRINHGSPLTVSQTNLAAQQECRVSCTFRSNLCVHAGCSQREGGGIWVSGWFGGVF